ncbi:VOC family protein [Amycolatopsis sp. K13G38]|uniref:VOC family protein n=1 Tax=Amycolatopsis acididurans TaxID=2724524 RepID=A0ABX1JBB1_9PSEU|nr:VOC family protein [Amycolatopsis acididurans]NKQ56779.1 VOC family protein [Amycolatopsis acididurans]
MTTKPLITCLWFDGQAVDAAHFYADVFSDVKIGDTVLYPDGTPTPGQVMTIEFEINGQKFVGLNGGPQFKFNESISFQVFCDGQDEVDYYWNALTADGGEEGPCGWVKDKFGLSWQVIPEQFADYVTGPDPAGAQRATQAMFGMKKLDVEALRKAYEG